jgi:hypothetical protein
LCNFFHSPVTSSLFGPYILLRTLFSNTLSLCSSLNARDQVLHPYETTGRIMVLYDSVYLCSELSSGLYCRVEWLSTDVSEVRTASIIRDE